MGAEEVQLPVASFCCGYSSVKLATVFSYHLKNEEELYIVKSREQKLGAFLPHLGNFGCWQEATFFAPVPLRVWGHTYIYTY